MSDAQPIEIIENLWIPLADGSRLAAKIWRPRDAERHPVPAVLEYIPYRKRDFKAVRDAEIHAYFAHAGYAGVRVDLRGSGDSTGVLRDEYLQQELDDGREVLRWLAAQSWCSGQVGMFGLSWGGFNGLQMAALNPPELHAVITVCSSDDRYADDVHYMGGCLLTDNLSWASTMFAYNSCPPDPQVVGAGWRERWLERLEGSGLWLHPWLQHQRRDAYWAHASVCEDFSRIQCPIFAVSGWADGYSNAVFRLVENLEGPRKGLIGAWGHKYPHTGGPGPAIDFLNECVRWWDRWLKGIPNGVDEEPVLRVWMQDSTTPLWPDRPGRWIAESTWPAPEIEARSLALERGHLSWNGADIEAQPSQLTLESPLSVGLFAGKWYSYAESTDLPWDQREEDGGALVFDTPPLAEDVELLGAPEVELQIAADKPVAMLAARLSDVAPSGHATRVTYGLLNLTHRHSHAVPKPLEPGRFYRVTVPLNRVGQRFRAGNRIRLSLSSSYWPLAWPAPESARLTLETRGSHLHLPLRPPKAADAALRDLGTPTASEPPATTLIAPARREWQVVHNLASNTVSLEVVNNDPRYRLDAIDLEIQKDVREVYRYQNDNYATLRGEVESTRSFKRGDWHAWTVTRTVLTSTETAFRIRATLDAYEGDTRVFAKSWDETVSRDLL